MKDTLVKKIVVMGPVGSGKSTQAALLAKHFVIPHVEMGELLRKFSKTNKEVREIVESGKLIPDELTLGVLKEELSKPQYRGGFVIDGVPRTLYQAENLPFVPEIVLYLRVRDSENIKRLLLRGRQDDTEEIIKDRLNIYHQQTAPVLDFYKKQNRLLEVDGEPQIEVIFKDILQKLKLSILRSKASAEDGQLKN